MLPWCDGITLLERSASNVAYLQVRRPWSVGTMFFVAESMTGTQFFPACDVGEGEVRESIEPFADEFKVQRLKYGASVREGYSGMILSYGWRGGMTAE